MIGNERVELILFDTTGQVIIATLAPVHFAAVPSLCPSVRLFVRISPAATSVFVLGARLGALSS